MIHLVEIKIFSKRQYVADFAGAVYSLFGWLVRFVAGSWRSTADWFVWEKNTVLTRNTVHVNSVRVRGLARPASQPAPAEQAVYFGTKGVYESSVENILTIKFVSVWLVSLDIIMASKISTLMDQCKAS